MMLTSKLEPFSSVYPLRVKSATSDRLNEVRKLWFPGMNSMVDPVVKHTGTL